MKLASLIESWDSVKPPERRVVIKHLIDRIIIKAPDPVRAKANGARFDYERPEIQWAKWDRAGNRVTAQPLGASRDRVPAQAARK